MYCLNETVQEFRELEEKGRSQKIFKKIFPTQAFKQKTHTAVCTSFEMQHGHTDLVSSCSLNCKHSSLHQYTYSSKSPETHAHVPCRIRMKVCAYSSACSTTGHSAIRKAPLHFLHIILPSLCYHKAQTVENGLKITSSQPSGYCKSSNVA